ncbi:MAG: UTP--glucose-1-phosphate uridylyltransferase, partial [Planctomycetota bacterium]
PKGTFPAAPITGKSLFQLHAEKILAARRRYEVAIPWYVMTSLANDAATRAFFAEHDRFGLPADDVLFFQQGWMPAVDPEGKLLMADKDRLAASPNGHGGTLRALRDEGMLDDMERRGIEVISYFQVDNALIKPVDPTFIGYHAETGSEFSSKALPKRDAEEGLGVFCLDERGEMRVVEYSDLPDQYKYAEDADGSLRFSAGNIAIHAIDVAFARRMAEGTGQLAFHRASKKVPHIDDSGRPVTPTEPNAVKFELFIFDALPHAASPLVLMVERSEEFAPIKNADAEDSPATARRAQVNLFGAWLEQAGVAVERDFRGDVLGTIEISPLAALDAKELARRLDDGTSFTGGLNIQD